MLVVYSLIIFCMKYSLLVIIIVGILGAGFVWWASTGLRSSVRPAPVVSVVTTTPAAVVHNFQECVSAGNPVMASYPAICRTPQGQTFTQDIGNAIAKEQLIRASTPRPGNQVTSPLVIMGEARGNWFFEASFPVVMTDTAGNVLGQGIAQAKSDWMTTEFVPFEATLTFSVPAGMTQGILLLKKDNPSGLPEHEDALQIPVQFVTVGSVQEVIPMM